MNPPQVVHDQVSAYKTEMDSIAQFVEQECSLEADIKYPASKLYEAYRHFCQAIGRKPQSTNAFKKALDKLTGCLPDTVLPAECSGSGIKPVSTVSKPQTSVGSVGSVGILENFSGGILWGLFGFAYIAYIPYTLISLL